jgi:hypothetical protein
VKSSAAAWISLGLIAMFSAFYVALAFSQVFGANRTIAMDKTALQKAQVALATHEATLLKVPGVVGVGIGMTATGTDAAIHVYLDVQATGGTIPTAIPKQLDSVPVRVINTDGMRAR